MTKRRGNNAALLLSLSWVGRDELLRSELRRTYPSARVRREQPLLVSCELSGREPVEGLVLAFSRQALPNAVSVHAASVNAWAHLFLRKTEEEVKEDVPIRIHVFPQTLGVGREGVRRAELIQKSIRQQLRRFFRRLRRQVIDEESGITVRRSEQLGNEQLVQLLLTGPEHGYFSVATPEEVSALRHVLAPVPGGYVEIRENKLPPSRAYLKLLEAQALFGHGVKRGDTVVDLGASPGSWSAVALEAGAQVTAVDRSPLAAELMAHRSLTFMKGDGFTFSPEGVVDWLLCDIIAAPERSRDLLHRWLQKRWCRNFCVTFKFKGLADLSLLDEVKAILREQSGDFLLRSLAHNKNEVTAIGRCRMAKSGSG